MLMFLNQKAVKSFAAEKGLRTSKEFIEELNIIVLERIAKACARNKSTGRKTLKKDELYM